jgi:hypothetical protein
MDAKKGGKHGHGIVAPQATVTPDNVFRHSHNPAQNPLILFGIRQIAIAATPPYSHLNSPQRPSGKVKRSSEKTGRLY